MLAMKYFMRNFSISHRTICIRHVISKVLIGQYSHHVSLLIYRVFPNHACVEFCGNNYIKPI